MNSEGARSREAREKEREEGQAGETERYGEGGHKTTILRRRRGEFQRGVYYVLSAQGSENTGRGGASD